MTTYISRDLEKDAIHSVYGYCRRMEHNMNKSIPIDIQHLCLIFYYKHEDYFRIIGDCILISEEKMYIGKWKIQCI